MIAALVKIAQGLERLTPLEYISRQMGLSVKMKPE